MNNTTSKVNEATIPVLIDSKKLQRARRLIKQDPTSWVWKQYMHMARQAYGVECEPPMPEIGDRNGPFICTYSNKENGEYAFTDDRIARDVKEFIYVAG